MLIKKLKNSFIYAIRGIVYVFKTESNFRIHCVVALLVFSLAVIYKFPIWKLIVLIFTVILVLLMEMINSAIERFTDLLKPRLHHYVLVVKDIMAGAVLITVLGAIIIGILLFFPYL